MICNNCSAEYDDELTACPECGAENEAASLQTEAQAESVTEDAVGETDEVQAEADETQNEADEVQAEALQEDIGDEAVKKQKKAPQPGKTAKREAKAKKRHRVASAFIIVIMCLIAALAVALTVLSITTDVFESDDTSEKVVAGVGFTSQEEKELELLLAKSFSVLKLEYNREEISVEDFLANIKPGDSGNIYSRLNGVNEPVQTTADPADRFAGADGAYAYYKLEESKVDRVLEIFSLESYRGENCEKYYYCDGYYYFAAEEVKATPEVSAEIVKSRRVLDGSYYVEGYFYVEKQGETVKTDNCHFVVEAEKDLQTGERAFVIRKVSKEPIFGSDGKLVDTEKNCEKKTEIIEGRTSDGKLVCVYTLEYPVVEGEDNGYRNINDFFKNAISVYQLKAESAQQTYADFISGGENEEKLPFVENVVADIVFENEKNLSFVAEISRFSPEDDANGVYKRTVEAYTFDKSSGDFVSKDDVLGKNYMLIGEVLYRIYKGYEYESLLPKEGEEENTEVYDETPSDRDGLGARIYESSWSYSQEGVTFYYLTEKGYVTEITIPFEAVEKIK